MSDFVLYRRKTCRLNACCWKTSVFLILTSVAALSSIASPSLAAESAEAIEGRLRRSLEFLAADAREGRGIGTKGLDASADYIAAEFAKLGLKTKVFDGTAFQKFQLTTSTELGPAAENYLTLLGPKSGDGKRRKIQLKLGTDFNTMAVGGSGKFDLPLVFVGYGISAKDKNYDDFGGLDAKGKAVVIVRRHPQQGNPHGPFSSTKGHSRHAYFKTKISNAYQHGAAMVILINDHGEIEKQVASSRRRWQAAVAELNKMSEKYKAVKNPSRAELGKQLSEIDRLADQVKQRGRQMQAQYQAIVPFTRAGVDNGGRDMPVVFCSRGVIDQVLKASLSIGLAKLEEEIDKDLAPKSAQLAGWNVVGQTQVVRKQAEVKNVIGVLEGQGPLADETIIIGAHYDHLGRGGMGSLARGSTEIHNGADDNGSGTASLLEVARQLASREKKLPRRVVFLAFTGEERGLLGSAYYVGHPAFPLDKTVAMLNMDMVGRLTDNKLIIQGVDTAKEFGPLIDELNKTYDFKLTRKPGGFGPSDHASFFAKQIPVMHFFTGLHKDYHRPSDDADKVNFVGMRRVVQMLCEVAVRVAQNEKRPTLVQTATKAPSGAKGDRPYFGSIPDFAQAGSGYAISGVTQGGPAEKAGIKSGDMLIRLGENKIGNLEDFDTALRKFKTGDKVKVVVHRDGKQITLEVTLDVPR